MWSSQNAAFDHIFDHLQTRTTWKQCSQEHGLSPFLDTKAPKIVKNPHKEIHQPRNDQTAKYKKSKRIPLAKNTVKNLTYPMRKEEKGTYHASRGMRKGIFRFYLRDISIIP